MCVCVCVCVCLQDDPCQRRQMKALFGGALRRSTEADKRTVHRGCHTGDHTHTHTHSHALTHTHTHTFTLLNTLFICTPEHFIYLYTCPLFIFWGSLSTSSCSS